MVGHVEFLATKYLEVSTQTQKLVNYHNFLDDYDKIEKEGLGHAI